MKQKVWPHIIKIKRSNKQSLEFLKGNNDKNTPFRKSYLRYQNRPEVGNDTITQQNQTIENNQSKIRNKNIQFQNNASASARKFHHAG